jgi:GH35 family endo-1,4-beta-xylanase
MNQFNIKYSGIDRQIREGHSTTAIVTILGENNKPLQNQEVTIAQKKHQFLFGCNGFDFVPLANQTQVDKTNRLTTNSADRFLSSINREMTGKEIEQLERLADKFLSLFNYATLPFYWGQFEPIQGQPATQRLMKTAKWCINHHLQIKGHPLCWHTEAPSWLLEMDNADILQTQIQRIRREVTGFTGLIDIWDVVNEGVIMPIFDKYDNGITRICRQSGRIQTIKTMFDAARSANPGAILLLNDFNISPAFDILIEGCLEAGVKIDAIGIQSHMHQGYWGVEKAEQVLETFSRFKLPIHFTEVTILSGHNVPPELNDLNDYKIKAEDWPSTPEGEERQARQVLEFYKTLMANPLVAGITWWDFADGKWLNAPSGLVRRDGSYKPVYAELLKLVKGEWWMAPTQFVSNQEGKVQFEGFFGEYELTCFGKTIPFVLGAKDTRPIEIHLDKSK